MEKSEYKMGDFLYGIPDSKESEKYNARIKRWALVEDLLPKKED